MKQSAKCLVVGWYKLVDSGRMQISGQLMLHVITHPGLIDKHEIKLEKDYTSCWQVKWDKKGNIWKLKKLRISGTTGNDRSGQILNTLAPLQWYFNSLPLFSTLNRNVNWKLPFRERHDSKLWLLLYLIGSISRDL